MAPVGAKALALLLELFGQTPNTRSNIRELAPIIVQESHRAGLDPVVTAAVITRESAWQRWALGKRGEVGLMQVKPDAAALQFCADLLDDLWEPARNIRCGLRLLRRAITTCVYLPHGLSRYNGQSCRRSHYSERIMVLLPLRYWLEQPLRIVEHLGDARLAHERGS